MLYFLLRSMLLCGFDLKENETNLYIFLFKAVAYSSAA